MHSVLTVTRVRRFVARSAVVVTLVACPVSARAGDAVALDEAVAMAVTRTVETAGDVAAGDAAAALTRVDAAVSAADAALAAEAALDEGALAPKSRRRVANRLRKLAKRLATARDSITAGDGKDTRSVGRLAQASAAGATALKILRKSVPELVGFSETGAHAGFHRPRRRVVLAIVNAGSVPCDDVPVVTVEQDDAASPLLPVEDGVETLGGDRWRVRLGPDPGLVRATVTLCGEPVTWTLFNRGSRKALRKAPLTGLAYDAAVLSLRVDRAGPPFAPAVASGTPDAFAVSPALPEGLALDPATGAVSGTPVATSVAGDYTVTARNARGYTATTLAIQVAPALPAAWDELQDGFQATPFVAQASVPVKLALLPDGRVLYNELMSGKVRVVSAAGDLAATPFATVPVLTGSERGLLGLAVSPGFAEDGFVYVFASTAAGGGHADRNQVLRYTAVGDVGTAPTVIVDDLPIGFVHNAGDIQFGPDGKLYVSVGDTGDEGLAQDDASLAGRILRYDADGGIPADNPSAASPEWCRGLRNSFDMAFHPTSGGLFASENGPDAHDELDFVRKGNNYAWGHPDPESIPGFYLGPVLRDWTPVIAPTGIAFHDGTNFGPEFADNLFLLGYDAADIRRMVMSGNAFTDIDAEIPFGRLAAEDSVDNKPLDALVLGDGSLLISTFTAIWRVERFGR